MALPAGLDTGTVKGTYVNSKGEPLTGKVTATPSIPVVKVPGVGVVALDTVSVDLDKSGSFTLSLISTQDADADPIDWTWSVQVGKLPAASMKLTPGQTVDMSSAQPVVSSKGVPNVIIGGGGGTTTVDGLTDATAVGRAVVKAADAAAARSVIGAGTSSFSGSYADLAGKPAIPTLPTLAPVATSGAYADLSGRPSQFPPAQHSHPLADVTGMTPLGQQLAAASNPAAVRSAAGITAVGSSLVTAADDAAARQALGIDQITADTAAAVGTATAAMDAVSALAPVASSGAYADLAGKPSIPASAADIGAVGAAGGWTGRMWGPVTELPTSGVSEGDICIVVPA